MKKRTKIAAVCGAAALLTMGAAMTSMAAGWTQQNGTWVYLDNSDNRIRNSWRRSGEGYYYLNSNGEMAVDTWIEDTYYVDIYGVMQTNRWVQVEPGTNDAPNSEGGWFYLDASGRAVTDSWRTINNSRYHFDSDGTMQYGWFNDDDSLYYLGDENDGAAKMGWLCLDVEEGEEPEDGEVSSVVSSGDMGKWFYFQNNGRAIRSTESDAYVNRNINGYRYYFDEIGVMATGWVSMADEQDGDRTGISTLKYFGDANGGQMATGWRFITDDPEDSYDDYNSFEFNTATSSNADRYSGDGSWYYFDNNGVPRYLNANASALSEATARISGESYFFDEYGRMQSGLLGFQFNTGTISSAYFGETDADGRMKRDRQTNVYEENGERSTFFFVSSGTNRGSGYSGERSGYLYNNGKLVRAESGEDFQVFQVGDQFYLVNEAGRVQNSNRFYRTDGAYRYEYSNGTIYYVDDDRQRIGEVTRGEELPEISYEEIYQLTE